MDHLLVIDDDPLVHVMLQELFADGGKYIVRSVTSAQEGQEAFEDHRPDVVLLDLNLPDLSGLEAFERLQHIDPMVPVIFITVSSASEPTIEAMKLGAFDYLVKPLDLNQVDELVTHAIDVRRLMKLFDIPDESADESAQSSDVLIGLCPAMQEVYKAIGRVAARNVTVLICGESGTGKELVVRAIFEHSQRSSKPFLELNCAAIPETLLESELFGHEKGAFTGADRRRIGKFEECSGGTLFLDEIGDMPMALQGKFLRVLQEQRFQRVGGNETITTDARIIAATHRDLKEAVSTGKFREDLYYRLNVFVIQLPPLRERLVDLPILVDRLVRRFGRELETNIQQAAPDLIAALAQYSWPGNIRELQSVLKQAILQSTGPILTADHLPEQIFHSQSKDESNSQPRSVEPVNWERFISERLEAETPDLYAKALELMEREIITRILQHAGGSRTQAAEILGITRGSLRNKIRSLGINIARVVSVADHE